MHPVTTSPEIEVAADLADATIASLAAMPLAAVVDDLKPAEPDDSRGVSG